MEIARKYGLFVLEDSCDALGSKYDGRLVGSFGDLASLSFYPAHHITMGEGGGVIVNNPDFEKIVLSLRDWGRDCWCETGKSNTCGRRFSFQLGDLPFGYDHKYIYSEIGFNFKITDLQAAIGIAQFDKLEEFISKRKENFMKYYTRLMKFKEFIDLPRWSPKADPSWFGFPITVKKGISRNDLISWLEDKKIETRLLFGGNIIRQPGFKNIKCRIHNNLNNSDRVMSDTFFIGVYPGLTEDMIDYVIYVFDSFFEKYMVTAKRCNSLG
jgi:CDP-6-deoxy-D-xylo-4-hexulose-3-dehydrase